ncbi:glucosamine-6-phosphate deaminase [Pseudarthrobacter phenanthrenivorans]|uniref:glucosamine-6-phosphate deaminase n=1 Tax=Pseudarthrobacter phenanthrenivorans TaxID=361575 RepID=UPI00112A8313|nr:glucosamine-6-phosphate deaminase [Pseudarthrobacter phenanthrenivorans]TPV51090.1 glucosamine-6-phosphate deaminase [Pseudarthrobacter phenanthrenivorans]
MEIFVVPDASGTGAVAAGILAAVIRSRPDAVLGVATGSSPLPVYAALAEHTLDMSGVQAFALDEYVGLPAGHPQSYAEVVRREVTERLGLDLALVSVPDGGAEDPHHAAALYDEAIRAAGGVDVQILGIGHNGHIAFNEPGSALDSRTRVEFLADRTRKANARYFRSIDDVPTQCITQGLGTIREARHLLMVVNGADKAEILAAALHGPVSPECPASVLQLHPHVTVVADEAAAALLGADLGQVAVRVATPSA